MIFATSTRADHKRDSASPSLLHSGVCVQMSQLYAQSVISFLVLRDRRGE